MVTDVVGLILHLTGSKPRSILIPIALAQRRRTIAPKSNDMSHTQFSNAAILLVSLAACVVQPLTHVEPPTFTVLELPKAPVPVFDENLSSEAKAKLQRAIAATEEVVRSEAFQRRLASTTNLYDRTGGRLVSPDSLLKAYNYDRLPVFYRQEGDQYWAGTSVKDGRATINLGARHINRWTEDTSRTAIRRRACIVNTIAHEWVHTVSASGADSLYLDDRRGRSRHPLVSYTVGSIAQCTVLENHRLLRHGMFWECVETVGTRVFRGASQCEDEGDLVHVLVEE